MAAKLSTLMNICMRRPILRSKPNKELANFMQVLYYKSYGQGATTCGTKSGARHTVNYIAYVRPCAVSHDEKNMALGRPMSPHLDIYGPTVPAMTSIAQRATGIALSALSFILAAGELFYPGGTCAVIRLIHSLFHSLNIPEVVVIALKAILAVVFLHHYLNGVRFVFFNLAKGLHLKTAYKTAWAAIALSFIGGAVTALIGHMY